MEGRDEQHEVPVDVLRWVRLAQLVLEEEKVSGDAELSVIFVGNDAIADLNERYLGGSGPTDVLAFPIDEDAAEGGRRPDQGGRGPGWSSETEAPAVLGDVLVCPTIAATQAAEHRRSLDDELALLVVHGVLHLLNYDHVDAADAAAMQRREGELLTEFRAREQSLEPRAER